MRPILPGAFLWTNFKSMDEFFNLDPVNEEFYEAFRKMSEGSYKIKKDALKVFNEVYYQLTRMLYEHPMPVDLQKYVADIKADLGWNDSADLVLSMSYFILQLMDVKARSINRFFINSIHERYKKSIYWRYFLRCKLSASRKKIKVRYSFYPRPIPASQLKGLFVHWDIVTNNFDLGSIEYLLNLWTNTEDKGTVAMLILESVKSRPLNSRDIIDQIQIERFIVNQLQQAKANDQVRELQKFIENAPKESLDEKNQEIENLKYSISRLNNRIEELVSENERLNSELNATKSEEQQERSFTLALIADYCRNKCDWDSAQPIFKMLNYLLRGIANDEDYELIDKVDDELKLGKIGNTYIKEQILIPSVGNYKPQITTQNIETPMPPSGQQQEQKQLEHE